MQTYTLGKKNGRPVKAKYHHEAGSLPELTLSGGASGTFRGSSLGPANYMSRPNEDDLLYWQSLAGMETDRSAIARSLAAHAANDAREQKMWDDYYAANREA